MWLVADGPLAEFAAAHEAATELVAVPDELAAHLPVPPQTLVPTADGLCSATLGPAELRPDFVENTVPTFLRALNGCGESTAPLALLCAADVRVPTDLRWAPFVWSEIAPASASVGDPIVQRAIAERSALEDVHVRDAVAQLDGATEIDRGRSAAVTVGTDEITAAQLGLAWFEAGVDVDTGCPTIDFATGEVSRRVGDRWSRAATGTRFVGVLHDADHVLALVEDSYSAESESCDGEHACFFVAVDTLDGDTFAPRSRAITMLTSGEIDAQSPLRFNDTREPCASDDE